MAEGVKKCIHINGLDYACQFYGQDASLPYLLMLHGFMGDGRGFSHLVNDLTKSCNPITIDLLGHGQTDKPVDPETYREKEQVDHLVALVNKIDKSPLFLYGYSMGGRLALKTAQAAPNLFSGLILESTNPGLSDKKERAIRRDTDKERASSIKNDFLAFLEKWEALPLFSSPAGLNSELSELYKQIHAEQEPEAMAAAICGFSPGSMKPVTKKTQNYYHPVLLIAGSGDQKYVTINKNMEQLFPKARLSILRAGHRVHMDNPDALGAEINTFIEQNS
ncbi:2-succinyl-6-hydroxy-2,4-cyclohexadiene-1-carboxylate synthase [Balneolaceae bacterium YR4-1]|uniref:2-succinyl-6-hydroxy-2,4-cyclohexadiene-1-carboxylate synthase n=1 Tax=Halalkalibaculum roseum TaxID=2709311 RepID=A0A6M1SN82_9BACT|nr:2-succinyl-6-hydroxy-2,4-cyclohexadiene-1-carboxylate synthase [Halalkalibaculum roseum]NGP76811.1 2-succinyl-6-hydroxy-2,4-cyclohexadiene-1-carboxylate synthase [Halalkalibaculum roseum]